MIHLIWVKLDWQSLKTKFNALQCLKTESVWRWFFKAFFLGGGATACLSQASQVYLSLYLLKCLLKDKQFFLTRFYSLCCYFTFIVKDSNVIVFTQSVVFLNKQLLHSDSCLPIFKNEQEFSFASGYRGQAHTDVRSAPAHVMWPI